MRRPGVLALLCVIAFGCGQAASSAPAGPTGIAGPASTPSMNPAATSAAAPVATIPSEPSPARSSDPGPIGSYTVVITAEDVAGSVSAHEVCENSGSFSLTIRPEGEWELLQSPAHGCGALIDPEGGGTWTADDDRIVFTDRGSFGCPAVFEYRWALNGDALTFSEVEDACPPRVVIFSARAWATVS